MRHDGRKPDQLRTLNFKRRYTRQAPGSVLVRMGHTTVLCTCCIELAVPPFLVGRGKGWLTAEWGLSDNHRKARFYSLTPAGRKQLEQETRQFDRLIEAIQLVMRTA